MNRGTVTAVDREKQTVRGLLVDGTDILSAKYTDRPPWPGMVATFEQVASNRWICLGTQGERGDYSPNQAPFGGMFDQLAPAELCPNGTFENASALPWAAVGNVTLATSTAQAHSGTRSLTMTRSATGGTLAAILDAADAIRIEQGRGYNAHAWVRANTTGRTCRVDVRYYDVAGTEVQLVSSAGTINDVSSGWTEIWLSTIAPEGAFYIGVTLVASTGGAGAAGEVHYWDDVSLSEAIPGVAVGGAKSWLFNTDTEGWVASGDRGVMYWTANEDYMSTPAAIVIYSDDAAETCVAESPAGTSGQGVRPGTQYTGTAFIKPSWDTPASNLHIGLSWFDSGGSWMALTSAGPSTTVPPGEWTNLQVTAAAPAGAAFVSVFIETEFNVPTGWGWYIDTAVLTLLPSLRIRQNEDPNYVYVGDRSLMMEGVRGDIGILQVPWGLNNRIAGAISVTPGDHVVIDAKFKNDAANYAYRNLACAVAWYTGDGAFTALTIGATNIASDPGGGWETMSETFLVPEGIGWMRPRLLWLTDVGQRLYLDELTIRMVNPVVGKIAPDGQIEGNDTGTYALADFNDVGYWGGGGWIPGEPKVLMRNPGRPVAVSALIDGVWGIEPSTSGLRWLVAEISIDGGLTWSAGQETRSFGFGAGGFGAEDSVTAAHSVRNLPVGDILARYSVASAEWYNDFVRASVTFKVTPA